MLCVRQVAVLKINVGPFIFLSANILSCLPEISIFLFLAGSEDNPVSLVGGPFGLFRPKGVARGWGHTILILVLNEH